MKRENFEMFRGKGALKLKLKLYNYNIIINSIKNY